MNFTDIFSASNCIISGATIAIGYFIKILITDKKIGNFHLKRILPILILICSEVLYILYGITTNENLILSISNGLISGAIAIGGYDIFKELFKKGLCEQKNMNKDKCVSGNSMEGEMISQEHGNRTDITMSQKAITKLVPYAETVNLVVSNWSDNYQEVVCSVASVDNIIMVSPVPGYEDDWSTFGIQASQQKAGKVGFLCDSIPDKNLQANIIILENIS